MARRAAAVSVVKKGLPVPAAKMTTRPFSRWRMARRGMNGSAISLTSRAEISRRVQPLFLQGVLQRDAVDHGGQHAHVVGRGAVDAQFAGADAAEEIAAAGDDGDLHSQVVDFLDLGGDAR